MDITKSDILHRETLDYVYNEIIKLIIHNFDVNNGQIIGEYCRGKDTAYKDMLRIITDILNKK